MKMKHQNIISLQGFTLMKKMAVYSAASLFTLSVMQAATITWTGQGTISDNTFLTLAGAPANEVYGVDFGAGAVTTGNNYTFDDYLSTGNFSVAGSAGAYNGYLNGQTSGDGSLDAVLANGLYGSTANSGTLNNLTVGQTYTVLAFIDDNRGSAAGGTNFRVDDGVGSSPTQLYGTYTSGTPGDPLGGYIMGTFTADATTQAFTVQNDNQQGTFDTGNAQYNGILLTDVPEPGACVLLGAGLALFAILRRKIVTA